MTAKVIAGIIYILILVVHGVVTAYNDITVRNGSFWALLFCVIGACICGRIIGGDLD
jgi:hypothetical protein